MLDDKVLNAINSELPTGYLQPLIISITYDVQAKFTKRLVLKIDWHIGNSATIRTVVLSKQAFMSTPPIIDDVENQPILVEMAKQSAEDFIEIANGRPPKHSVGNVKMFY